MPPTIEPPVESAPDAVLDKRPGDIWREQLAKVKIDPAPATKAPDENALKDAAKEEIRKEEEAKKVISEDADKAAKEKADKPAAKKSALDAVLGDAPAAKKEEVVIEDVPADAPVKKLREAYERHKSEVVTLKAELAKRSAPDPEISSKLETIQRERDQLREEVAKYKDSIVALNVDYDPEVQEKFVQGRIRQVDRAANRAKEYGGNEEAFREALQLSGKRQTDALREALADVDELDRPRIIAEVEKIRALDEEYADLKKDPQQAWKNLSERRQQELQAQQEAADAAKNKVVERVLKSISTKAKLLTQVDSDAEGADDWNKDLAESRKQAAHLRSDKATYEEIVEASEKAARYDFAESLVLSERARHADEVSGLRAELAKYEGSEPGFQGRNKTTVTSPLDRSPADIYREQMDKAKRQPV